MSELAVINQTGFRMFAGKWRIIEDSTNGRKGISKQKTALRIPRRMSLNRFPFSLIGWSPADALSGSVTGEADRFDYPLAIQTLDGVVQAIFLGNAFGDRQGIVDSVWPTHFLEGGQDQLLIASRPIESFNDLTGKDQHAVGPIPTGRGRTLHGIEFSLLEGIG